MQETIAVRKGHLYVFQFGEIMKSVSQESSVVCHSHQRRRSTEKEVNQKGRTLFGNVFQAGQASRRSAIHGLGKTRQLGA
jgi:hypothetical protein